MKTQALLALSLASLLLNVGCGNQSSNPPVTDAAQPPSSSSSAGTAVQSAVQPAANAVVEQTRQAEKAVTKAVSDAQPALSAAASDASAKAQSMIDSIKKLIAENKWQEAFASLQQLGALKLTPEQQAVVDGLKQQVQSQLQSAATKKATEEGGKALNNLLKK